MPVPNRRVPVVLVAVPDDAERTAVSRVLAAAGIEVKTAKDGPKALELAVLDQPDLVIYDAETAVLDPARFCEILRGNPRTESTPVVVTGNDSRGAGLGLTATFVPRPFTVEALGQRVRELLRSRSGAVQAADAPAASMVQGNLAEIALVDLLQIFVMNRKEGKLVLTGEPGNANASQEGEIHLRAGQITHARSGATEGTKALYRLLGWRRGRFSYQPGPVAAIRTIKAQPDAVVMEGMRQTDELARLADRRPPDRARVVVTMDRKGLPEDLHRTTREVLALTEFYASVGEILDRAASTDFEVLRALALLEEKGVLYFDTTGAEPPPQHPPLIDATSLAKLRGRSAAIAPGSTGATWKVVVFTRDRTSLKRFFVPFSRLPGFVAVTEFFDPQAATRPPIGATARLPLAEGHHLEFVACPTSDLFRPLLGLFGERALAGIVVQEGNDPGAAALAAQVGEALGSDAIPLDLASFSPAIAPPSDGSEARQLVSRIVSTALKVPRASGARGHQEARPPRS